MKRYQITFTGRKAEAIGKFYTCHATRKANSADEAVAALHDEYEYNVVHSIVRLDRGENGCAGCWMYRPERKGRKACTNGNAHLVIPCGTVYRKLKG